MTVFHHHNQYGPVCGVRDGVNALDFGGHVTCKRCLKIPPEYWRGTAYEYRDGKTFIVKNEDPEQGRRSHMGLRERWSR